MPDPDPDASTRGRTVAFVAIVGGIALAIAGSAIILATGGLREDVGAPVGPSAVDMHAFDRSCERDDECVVVLPAKCTECACVAAGLARRDLERFNVARAALRCPPRPAGRAPAQCPSCPSYEVACVDHRCTVPGP